MSANQSPLTQVPPLLEQLQNRKTAIAVIGLGYVGLPIALEFARHFSVIGFDINAERVEMMRNGSDPSRELPSSAFKNKHITFTNEVNDLRQARFYIVAVPTPVDRHRVPDLRALKSVSETLGKVLKKGDYIVYESTVYPGCTEEDCVPVMEQLTGLKMGVDFKVGYSPERINPGDKEHTITKITKVVSGCDAEALETIAVVYAQIIEAGVYKARSIKVAEAAKVIENTQRDLNIALMNELSVIFDRMDINMQDVLAAARTKWNFLPFYPGLVGGHCIGVDPYYLTYKSTELGYKPEVILSGRRINDGMSSFIAKRVVQMIIKSGKHPSEAKVLVMGITFKENVSDIRNSKVTDLVKELEEFSVSVHISDPYAEAEEVQRIYGLQLTPQIDDNYDCIIVAVNHTAYAEYDEAYFKNITSPDAILVDIKGIYNHKIKGLQYWTL